MTTDRRAKLQGVARSRAHQILAGAIVADETLYALDVDSIDVSPWALREGVILQHLSAVPDPQNDLPLQVLSPEVHVDKAVVTSLPITESSHDRTR